MVMINMSANSSQAKPAKPTDNSSNPIELNVGGTMYVTTLGTLLKKPDSLLAALFKDVSNAQLIRDSKGNVFIDRDGVLFRYILDYLRNLKLVLPENFHERDRLKQEAEYFKLPDLVSSLRPSSLRPSNVEGPSSKGPSNVEGPSSKGPSNVASTASASPLTGRVTGYITIGYRGTFTSGRDGVADTKFRKVSRIIVCGKVSLCREVFKDTLNETRDPDRGETHRYSARFFLNHTFLELAFDMLQEEGFNLVGCCGTGTNNTGEIKPGMDTEEAKWQHSTEFLFERR